MYKSLQYQTEGRTVILATRDDGSMVGIEPTSGELWTLASTGALGAVAAYVPPPEPTAAEVLDEERARMRCSTAQMGLALIAIGDLEDAEEAFTADPSASMIWSKATHVARRGPILAALQTFLGDTEIDDLFRAAMAVEI